MEPNHNKTFGAVGKLIKLCFFGCKNLQILVKKIEHRNFPKRTAT